MGPPEDKLPLPKGWVRTFSNSQKRYYYSHSETKHTQWHFPTASEASDPWMAKRRAESNSHQQQSTSLSSSTTTLSTTLSTTTTATTTTARPTKYYHHPNSIVTWNCNGF
mmetsp:Transcript_3483/g.8402  ORF Transcript_3483/g.8402 Transcript_3483/m.8402 type:complete len:110 (+) Transcript_3483:1823-2152(+)